MFLIANATRSGQKTTLPQKYKRGKKKASKKKIFFRIILTCFALGFAGLLAGGGLFAYYASSAPKLADSKLASTTSSKLYGLDDQLIADLGSQERVLFNQTDMPQTLKDAVVSVEDQRFFKHFGVDPIRIAGSVLHNFTHSTQQGGSTLTQQLIKLSFFSTKESDQTLKRKAQEAWLALKLERVASKDEILCYYMNKVYMSNGLYGMKTAIQAYYGVEPSKLTLAQTALIAGLPQAPNSYNPYQDPEAAKYRRDVVLYTMYYNKKITKAQYDEAKKEPITQGLKPLTSTEKNVKAYDAYVKQVIEEVSQKTGKDLFTDGMDIYTNLDMEAQKRLYDIVNTNDYVNWPNPEMQTAVTLIDTATGQVRAQIGGRNIPEDVTFGNNLAVNKGRDWGSTMKPMVDYGPAIENLSWGSNHMLDDSPYNYPGTTNPIYDWDRQYYGWMSMRQAITLSRNIPALKTLEAVGLNKSQAFLKKIGIEFKDLVYSNAISSNQSAGSDYGVSSEDIAAAYATFANGGTYNKPYYVNKIVFQDGTTQTFKTSETHRAMKETTAYMITDMLKDVISTGTGNNAKIAGLFQAGKTGTSSYSDEALEKINSSYDLIAPDENFVGYSPHYAIAVWTGYNDLMTPLDSSQFNLCSDVYRCLMEFVSKKMSNKDWKLPSGLKRIGNELVFANSPDASRSSAPASSQSTTSVSESSSSQPPVSSSTSSEPSTSSSSDDSSSSTSDSSSSSPPSSEPAKEP